MFFQIQLDHSVPMFVKKVSNTCSAITYYINRLTQKNCKGVTTSNPTAQLTDQWAHILQLRDIVNNIFLSSNILSISLHIIEWKLKDLNKSTVLTSSLLIESRKKRCENNFKNIGTICTQFHKSRKFFCSVIQGLTTFGFSRHIFFFTKVPQYQISRKSVQWEPALIHADKRTAWRRQQALLATKRTRLTFIVTDIHIALGNENLNNKTRRQKCSALRSLILLRCMQVKQGYL
jgi:hypothetical protein